jgi:hypothetical protein
MLKCTHSELGSLQPIRALLMQTILRTDHTRGAEITDYVLNDGFPIGKAPKRTAHSDFGYLCALPETWMQQTSTIYITMVRSRILHITMVAVCN